MPKIKPPYRLRWFRQEMSNGILKSRIQLLCVGERRVRIGPFSIWREVTDYYPTEEGATVAIKAYHAARALPPIKYFAEVNK